VGPREREAGGPLAGGEDRVPLAPEDEREKLEKALVVVDQEQGLAGGASGPGARHGDPASGIPMYGH
jgi:hypothetical protein